MFSGLGDLGEKYHIQLKEGAIPYCTYTPETLQYIRESASGTRQNGKNISQVNEPTQWCAVEQVRRSVDLKALNDNVLRKVHPIPKVDKTLTQLAGEKIFSKLDANSGFWQIHFQMILDC